MSIDLQNDPTQWKQELTIRLKQTDLKELEKIALEEGKSVEILIGSIISKYLDGRIK